MNPIDTTQEEDVEMEDVKDDSNQLQGTATQTDPIAEEVENEPGVDGGMDLMTPSSNQPIMEGGGTTPITPETISFWSMRMKRRTELELKLPLEGWLNPSPSSIWILPHPHLHSMTPLVATRRPEEPTCTPARI